MWYLDTPDALFMARDHAGKALLVTLWATWCPHCVEEMSSLNKALALMD